MMKEGEMPIWRKVNLTVEEMALYTNIGENTLRELLTSQECQEFILYVGKKKLIKRKEFEAWIQKQYIIK